MAIAKSYFNYQNVLIVGATSIVLAASAISYIDGYRTSDYESHVLTFTQSISNSNALTSLIHFKASPKLNVVDHGPMQSIDSKKVSFLMPANLTNYIQ